MNELENLKREIAELKAWKKSLEASSGIPLNNFQALKARLNIIPLEEQIEKGATTENRTVNEGGVATYDVLKAPDGFDRAIKDGTVKYYPWFYFS